MKQKLLAWLDERTGFVGIARTELFKPLPKGVGWAFSLGNLTMMLLLVQIVTGVALALNYAPTPDHAHDSIQYITGVVLFGRFLRSVHFYTASAVVVVICLHMMRVIIWGAYKKPRELTWILGIALLMLVMGFAFTGYLLPWDQRAYWATTVGTQFATVVPGIGHFALRVLRGGDRVGALTLMRFYTAHTMLLPALLVPLIGFHLFLVRRIGSGGAWKPTTGKGEPFYPNQAYRDILVAVVAFALVLGLAFFKPIGVEPVADPTASNFVPVPEWYFLWLYQGLKYIPGSLEIVGVLGVPTLLLLGLLLLPWLDRGPDRNPVHRPRVLATIGVVVLIIVALTGIALATPPPRPAVTVTALAAPTAAVPAQSVPPAQVAAGHKVFQTSACDNCHSIGGKGGQAGPALDAVGATRTQDWMAVQITSPTKHNPSTTMPAFKLSAADLQALTAYLSTLRGATR